MRYLLNVIFLCFAFINFAFADWEELSKTHFKLRVGNQNYEQFVQQEVDNFTKLTDKKFNKKIIQFQNSTFETYYVPSEQELEDGDLIQMSTLPHFWIKYNSKGELLEFGSSFLLSKDTSSNPRNIEQEVFYFSGKNKRRAFIANW